LNPKPKHNEQTTATQPTSSHYSYYCIFSNRYLSKHLKQPTMKLTAMQDLIDDFNRYLKLDLSPEALNMIQLIKDRAVSKLLMERKQIESAYDSAKNEPDTDGSKYYFMNYITND
jgi:hypothetical protein